MANDYAKNKTDLEAIIKRLGDRTTESKKRQKQAGKEILVHEVERLLQKSNFKRISHH